jgi:glutamate formiminotransferase
VSLLDVSADPDHNRSVLTLAGEPEALLSGLLALYERALGEIDLRQHQGVHPRLGAVDVVPFVPLGATPMSLAVATARRLAAAVAERFRLPVYLYEEAASRPDRRPLAAVRRGGFEGLAAKLAAPGWAPDHGPAHPHPSAGATVVGARRFLIACNAVLDAADPAVARAIAAAVRETGGGLPAVRALGFFLASQGRAQVSMNLVDHRRTSLRQALDRVGREAAARGTRVLSCEVVGLVPREAARDAPDETLCPGGSVAGRVLEERWARGTIRPILGTKCKQT